MKMNKHILIVTSLLAATALQAQEIKVKDIGQCVDYWYDVRFW